MNNNKFNYIISVAFDDTSIAQAIAKTSDMITLNPFLRIQLGVRRTEDHFKVLSSG